MPITGQKFRTKLLNWTFSSVNEEYLEQIGRCVKHPHILANAGEEK